MIDVIGWIGTVMLVASYLINDRKALHWFALAATFLKLVYCYHYQVWPLVVNWLILIGVHFFKLYKLHFAKGVKNET